MSMDEIREKLARLAEVIRSRKSIVAFTGAGISTSSGISDYRSKGGLWERYQPVYFQEFLESEEKRLEYWRRKVEMWPQIRDARPSSGHSFIRRLHDQDALLGVITQNIDGLHEMSGVPREKIVNLHGNNREIVCLSCGAVSPADQLFARLDLSRGTPRCEACGGLLKPNTISFGQNLTPSSIHRAESLTDSCDLMLVLGSTLIVYPAAGFPAAARRRGATLAIINLSATPLDGDSEINLRCDIDFAADELTALLDDTPRQS